MLTPEKLSETHEPTIHELSVQYSRKAHEGLLDYGRQTVHGSRFDLIEYDERQQFQLEHDLIPAQPNDEKLQFIFDALVPAFTKNADELTEEIVKVLERDEVKSHTDQGGSTVFALPHITYEDAPTMVTGLTKARISLGEKIDEIAPSQVVVTGRLVSLFELPGVNVYEDGLLPQTNILQTLPSTASGKAGIPKEIRRKFVDEAMDAIDETLNTPSIRMIINMSGMQDIFDEETRTWHMARVNQETSDMIIAPNQDGADKVQVIPVFIRNQALAGNKRLKPDVTDYAFGEAIIPHTREDIHEIMQQIAVLGNTALAASSKPNLRDTKITYGRTSFSSALRKIVSTS